MPVQVFLAHASEDKTRIRQLHKQLTAKGFRPWLDELDIMPGKKWTEEIPRAIDESDVFLACLSKTSVQKQGYVQKEFRLALVAYSKRPPDQIFLIPVKLDDCAMPRIQMPDVGIDLADFQWVDLSGEDGFDRLVKAIESVIQPFHPPGTEKDRQQPLTPCKFEVSPKYAKASRWKHLADVLVELHKIKTIGDVFLIPSGAAPQSLRHTETLRSSAKALAQKRAATELFIDQHQDQEIDGKWFKMRTRIGECTAVYSAAYDRFLREHAAQHGKTGE